MQGYHNCSHALKVNYCIFSKLFLFFCNTDYILITTIIRCLSKTLAHKNINTSLCPTNQSGNADIYYSNLQAVTKAPLNNLSRLCEHAVV